jgi:GNAT superfamily N-acetyltransferase
MNTPAEPATAEVVCREILDLDDPVLPAARAIYESTLDEDERIPWEWLARTPERRRDWRPGRRRSHLVVATPRDEPNRSVGFGYGAFLPDYGGYVCYMGVEPAARGRGAGTLLFRFLFRLIDSAARISSVPLPFIIWESHRPADPGLWAARLRVFDKVGGLWMRGAEMLTPNYMRDEAPPVRLQLFIRPWAEPAEALDANRLRAAVEGLYDQVYRIPPDDPLRRDTLDGMVNPRLVPAVEALEEPPVPLSPGSGGERQ